MKQSKALVAAGLVVAAGAANAAQDVTALTGAITDIAAVGTAVFAVYVAIKLTKWVRRAL